MRPALLLTATVIFLSGIWMAFSHGDAVETVSTKIETGYGHISGPAPAVDQVTVRKTTYRDTIGRTWTEETILKVEEVPGGLASIERKMYEAALREQSSQKP